MKLLSKSDPIIARTLRTSVLIDAFWERWLVHGVEPEDVIQIRRSGLKTVQDWVQGWYSLAQEKEQRAHNLCKQQRTAEAEHLFRIVGLYYNLSHWIHPDRNTEKKRWYVECLRVFQYADSLSPIETRYANFQIDNHTCSGRIRVPSQPVGCIIIVNPIDSTKEELFKYEEDFYHNGFVTISFDGPGQGESYTLNGLRGTKNRWELFMVRLIEFAASEFSDLPIHLFGTSLGAAWAIYGSCHPLIKKTVAVSPAVEFEKLHLPTYFLERMDLSCTLVPEERAIPDFKSLQYRSPVLLFHGKKDQMVLCPDMYQLYERLPAGKRMIEFDEEGHCCNNKLEEIRQYALRWFEADY